jgi:hypothetical protein
LNDQGPAAAEGNAHVLVDARGGRIRYGKPVSSGMASDGYHATGHRASRTSASPGDSTMTAPASHALRRGERKVRESLPRRSSFPGPPCAAHRPSSAYRCARYHLLGDRDDARSRGRKRAELGCSLTSGAGARELATAFISSVYRGPGVRAGLRRQVNGVSEHVQRGLGLDTRARYARSPIRSRVAARPLIQRR